MCFFFFVSLYFPCRSISLILVLITKSNAGKLNELFYSFSVARFPRQSQMKMKFSFYHHYAKSSTAITVCCWWQHYQFILNSLFSSFLNRTRNKLNIRKWTTKEPTTVDTQTHTHTNISVYTDTFAYKSTHTHIHTYKLKNLASSTLFDCSLACWLLLISIFWCDRTFRAWFRTFWGSVNSAIRAIFRVFGEMGYLLLLSLCWVRHIHCRWWWMMMTTTMRW